LGENSSDLVTLPMIAKALVLIELMELIELIELIEPAD
jgi:hypothetical protein